MNKITRANKGRTGRRGFFAVFEPFSGFEFFLLLNIVHARPAASSTSRLPDDRNPKGGTQGGMGCGGWSRRTTLYGGDQTPGRSAELLDPKKDAARIRPMYTDPNHTRKGVGRLIISLCEDGARAEGFTKMELVATLSGEPLYRTCGFEPYERINDDRGGAGVPLLRMRKSL